jgi:hypothetical protein
MKILAFDLGKYKTMACLYDTTTHETHYRTVKTRPMLLFDCVSRWLTLRYNSHLANFYRRVCRGSAGRRKIAVVAVARKLLVTAWAMLRDGRAWSSPPLTQAA